MGRHGSDSAGELTLSDLPDLLGEALPDLPKNAVGRFRLLRSLKARFGPNFRALPGVSNLLREFDGVVDLEIRAARLRGIKIPKGDK